MASTPGYPANDRIDLEHAAARALAVGIHFLAGAADPAADPAACLSSDAMLLPAKPGHARRILGKTSDAGQ